MYVFLHTVSRVGCNWYLENLNIEFDFTSWSQNIFYCILKYYAEVHVHTYTYVMYNNVHTHTINSLDLRWT